MLRRRGGCRVMERRWLWLRAFVSGLLMPPVLANALLRAAPARPVIDGTFIQDWLSQGWDDETWDREFAYLQETGMHYLIVAPTAETVTGGVGRTIYPTELSGFEMKPGYPDLVEKYLHYAQKYGLKVFIGLNFNDQWWKKGATDRQWLLDEMEKGNRVATELYRKYHSRYPDTFYGWYWVWEVASVGFQLRQQEEALIAALNLQLDHLTALDPNLPFLFCPFMNQRLGTKEQYRDSWIRVFAKTRFRPGDIFAPQDSVGAGGLTIDSFVGWFVELRKAVDTKPGLLFWSDAETFVQEDWSSAPLSRFIRQLNDVAPYVDNIISFAYTHYYSPNLVDPGFHRTYLDYVNNGTLEQVPPSAPGNVRARVLDSGGVVLVWDPSQDNIGIYSYTVYRDGKIVAVNKVARPGKPSDDLFFDSFVDTDVERNHTYVYQIQATDFAGNLSELSEPLRVTVE